MSVSNQQPNQREQESQEHVGTNETQPSGSISELESSSSGLKQDATTESSTERPLWREKPEETKHTMSEGTSKHGLTASLKQASPTNLQSSFRIVLAAILIVLTVVTIKAGSILNHFLGLPLAAQIALSIIQAELSIVTILSAFPPVSNWFSQLWQSWKPILKVAISLFSIIILLVTPVLGTWLLVQYESKQPHNTTKSVSTHTPTASTTTPLAQGTSYVVPASTSGTGTKNPVTPTVTGSTPSVTTVPSSRCGSASFTMFGFDLQHTHYNPNETCLSTSKVSSLTLNWKAATGGTILSSPVVANGIVYIGSYDGKVYAFNVATGTLRWSSYIGGSIQAPLTLASGLLYIAPIGPTLYALNASTGTTAWTATVGSSGNGITSSSPLVVNNTVYIGAADAKLYAFNASTGQSLWTTTTLNNRIDASPTYDNGVVYLTATSANNTDNNMYAINASNGTIEWTATLQGSSQSSPAIANGLVYVGSAAGAVGLQAFNASGCGSSTCTPVWSASLDGGVNSSAAVANGMVYIGTTNGTLYAFNTSNGGNPLWSYHTGASIYSTPAIANGVIYVGSEDHSLYALNATTGAKLWSYATGNTLDSSPAVVNGVVYIGSTDDYFYAFQLPGTMP